MLNLLIIEDDVIDQLALTRLVKKNNLACKIQVAVKIDEARQLLQNQTFDIVICDLNLPDGKAFDLGELIKKQAFILLSGHLEDEIVELAKAYGAVQVLQKSSELTQLTSVQDLIVQMLNEQQIQKTKMQRINSQKAKFNLQNLMNTFDNQTEPVSEIIEAILDQTPKMLEEIQSAIDEQKRSSIKLLAHRLKSNYIMIGLKEQHKLAEQIELESTVSDLKKINSDLHHLRLSLAPIYPELQNALRQLKNN